MTSVTDYTTQTWTRYYTGPATQADDAVSVLASLGLEWRQYPEKGRWAVDVAGVTPAPSRSNVSMACLAVQIESVGTPVYRMDEEGLDW